MAVKPILFSGSMVRAILDGRKTMTRRILKPRKGLTIGDLEREGEREALPLGTAYRAARHQVAEPRFAPGDLLWVRETWSTEREGAWDIFGARLAGPGWATYRADGERPCSKWFPSIFMPREFSRLTLAVTAVKVERLQDISEDGAIAEGADQYASSTHLVQAFDPDRIGFYREGFRELWDRINGAGAWEANPWIAAVSFTVHRANVDAVLSQREAA